MKELSCDIQSDLWMVGITHKAICEMQKYSASMLQRTIQSVVSAGSFLQRIKDSMPHGDWMPFVDEYLDFSLATAENYLNLYHYAQPERVQNLHKCQCLRDAYQLAREYKRSLRPYKTTIAVEKLTEKKALKKLDRAVHSVVNLMESVESAVMFDEIRLRVEPILEKLEEMDPTQENYWSPELDYQV